ncbi:sulfite exporter TauE/SafE family protein [Mycobacterium shigaense]|uniref:sulfite exporter TauE/SafE family protein n=1 Tax=Mycobacterium shigaense TaxID=722731 RepID=UPI000BBADECB|nr:sulfite exporter TauE/SafE family protein [Mycobacterium shigaense]PRI12853.1 hypothetical protein B2J96_23940 [Mycobacterium shigaense]
MSVTAAVAASFAAGLGLAILTAPVGVSGAVFLLPVQFSVLHIPSPAVTPTNLLFNVIATPGALARYWQQASLWNPLTAVLLVGTVPGVIVGAVIRVFLLPGAQAFRLIAAAFLLPLGVWLLLRHHPSAQPRQLSRRFLATLAIGVGVIGGIYGIGGGSLLSPILVGRGLPVTRVAPAALTSTFATSIAGALTYTALAVTAPDIAPNWLIGITAGLGGVLGGYLGAALQPQLPERILRTTLGLMAIGIATTYLTQVLT